MQDQAFIFPTSFAQQRLWVLDQLDPGASTYNLPAAFRLVGELNEALLVQCFNAIVERHEALRTTFAAVDGQPMQVITPDLLLEIPLIDLQQFPAETRQIEVQRLIVADANAPFDLTHGPLIRVTLLHLTAQEHVVLLTLHHSISDGWSIEVLFGELAALYSAFAAGQADPLPELAIQYADFAIWQAEWLQGDVLEAQLAYWRQQLAGSPPVLELPTDHPRPAVQTFHGTELALTLAAPLSAALRTLSQREGVSLFMTMLAAFQTLLYRYTGQDDVVVGTPIAGRNQVELEPLIGCFLNTLVLRTSLAGDPSFRSLLGRVRETALGAYTHQDIPFEKLLEELKPERDLSRTPLFQVFFNMINTPAASMKLPGLDLELIATPDIGSKFDLTMYVIDRADVLHLELVYNADLFAAARMEELLAQFELLLTQVVAQPDQPIARLALVTQRVQKVLPDPQAPLDTSWNGPIHRALSSHATRTPQQLAVVDDHESWTYADLEAGSNQLAYALLEHGIQPQDVVAVYGHRSARLVWALMGVLKAGATFLILDPAYPAGRLIDYLDTAHPQGWLQLEAAGPLPAELATVVDTDRWAVRLVLPCAGSAQDNLLATLPTTAPAVTVEPNHVACLTFTSGSAGRPKAVLGRHGPLTHFMPWQQTRFGLSAQDRFSMLSGLAHDPLQRDIFTPLWLGATICVPDPDQLGQPGWLADWMVSSAITIAHLTPALGQLLTEVPPGSATRIQSLRFAFIVGDVLTRHDVAMIRSLAPAITCVNFYGSTETQRAVSYYPVPAAVATRTKEVLPLGQGIPDVQLLVLNSASQLAGVGELGEIYNRSPHLAQGYLGDEPLTHARFVTNPFTGLADDRLYRTGDLGRYLPDGTVEFCGRVDQQVKLRGYRIEPGEIESVLSGHAAVREAAVIVREDTPGDQLLVAYVVATPDQRPTSAALRSFLQARLPEFMVPAAFMVLDALPLTPNRKLDRRALPRPVWESAPDGSVVAPRTAVEAAIAAIWSRVLGVEALDIHANFFTLGGHSLKATQVMAQIRDQLQCALPLRALFEAPTIAGLAERSILGDQRPDGEGLPLQPQPRPSVVPLSFSQQRLWFLSQLDPTDPAYTIRLAFQLRGPLDQAALSYSWNTLIQRHEILRTTFVTKAGQPAQVVAPHATLEIELIEVADLDPAERTRLIENQTRQPFDLERGPLLRIVLLRFDSAEHILLITMHHLISDAWSSGVMVQELTTLYAATRSGQPATLPALPIQYADFALWQQAWLHGAVLDHQLTYWRKHLAGAPLVLDLPTDYPRPPLHSSHDARKRIEIAPELAAGLAELSQREGVTLFMTLLAGFQLLLSRYSRQDELVVGAPIANRTRPEVQHLIGCFINTLVLRADLRGNPTVRDLLARTREVCLGAYAHQDLPFEVLVEALQPERDLSRSPLFQVLFNYHNVPPLNLALADITLEQLEINSAPVAFDLALVLVGEGTDLSAVLSYNPAIFADASMERLLQHLQTVLAAMVADPAQRITDLPLLTAAEQRHMLTLATTAQPLAIPDLDLIARFEAQVAATPTALALIAGETHLTYAALNQRANQLAQRLRELAVGPDVLVALALDRSADLVISMLAILKAGGAYLPLDLAYPSERLAFLLADSQARLILTHTRHHAALPPHQAQVLDLDQEWTAIAQSPPANPSSVSTGAHLAYSIYTSGSTGQPKGVQISRQAVITFLGAMAHTPGLTSSDTLLAVTSLAFDIAVLEIFLPLISGARLVLAERAVAADGVRLAHMITAQRVTLLQATPATWRMLIDSGWPGAANLTVLVGGEALPLDLAAALTSRCAAVWNMYGPTETTVWSAVARVTAGMSTIPLGRPIAQTQIYVLDRAMQPVPYGVLGEIYIGGAGVARGYLDQPGLTAERFVPDPFAGQPGGRLYRTGDLGRYVPDGQLAYAGRSDFQVKLRGYRIELGEIEAVLSGHPAVREAVVLVREDTPGDQLLVAYVVATPDQRPSSAALRSFLQTRLPEFMVPAAFMVLDALPLTPNRKLDRRALPRPVWEQPQDGALVAPRTAVEATIAAIWSRVLGVEALDIHANFFTLGGHSLKATQVMAQIRDQLQCALPLRALFEAPTIAGLAERSILGDQRPDGEGLPLQPQPRPSVVPLSFSQQRLWFLSQLDPTDPAYTIGLVFQLLGPLDQAALAHSWDALIQRHEILRTTFVTSAGQPAQVVAPHATLDIELLEVADLDPAERVSFIENQARQRIRQPFDLERGPLLRIALLRFDSNEHVLVVVLHHLISDAWSSGVILQELTTLYAATRSGQPATLPALPVQYVDFTLWQQAWLHGAVLEHQLAYWRNQLAGAPPVLDLPTDYPRPLLHSPHGARRRLDLPPELAAGLAELSQREGVTLFMTLLAGFQLLLSRYSRQDDLVVGAPIANRTRPEVQHLIGCFINTLVLRADLRGNPTVRDLLARTREVCLGAYAHQDLPFEVLVEALQPERDLSRSPVFQVLFNYQSMASLDMKLGDITLQQLEVDSGSVTFDLALVLVGEETDLSAILSYNPAIFAAASMERLLQHLQTVLAAMVADPAQRITDLPLLTAAEQRHMLALATTAQPLAIPDLDLVARFEAQVAATPAALALVAGDTHLTYAKLNQRANQLAQRLRELAVGPDVLVALALDRSADLVISMLAILKAGGAYLPLDLAYPSERLAFLLADSQARLILTHTHHHAALPPHQAQVLDLDQEWAAIAQSPPANPSSVSTGAHLAYSIYTSGSTGQPKGVQISRQAVITFLGAMAHTPGLTSSDTLLAVTSLAFDIAVLEIFLPLISGARLVLAERAVAADGVRLAHMITAQRVTLLQATPATWRMLIDSGWPGAADLTVLVGGEALPLDLAAALTSRCAAVWNMYGPTETTVWSAVARVTAGMSTIPLGRPIAQTQIYVLDRAMQPVPYGVLGEIYIGGAGVARGYLDRPGLTAERFVPDPFAGQPGGRLYRTGDLGRYVPDGQLAYAGRSDFQVKLRGYRIELGEIEAVLSDHPAVREAVVLVREDTPGDQLLVAYVVATPDQRPSSAALRSFLQERLPEFMVPAAFMVLDALPLTPNRKLDRRALPRPVWEQPQDGALMAPRTAVEAAIAAIWSQVLGVEALDIHANFFTLGGHSLKATQVMAQIRDQLQCALPLRALFEAPTIAGLAERSILGDQRPDGEGLPLQPQPRPAVVPLSFSQQRLWFLDQLESQSTAYTIMLTLRLIGPLDQRAFVASWAALSQRHETLRTTFATSAGQPFQQIAPPSPLPVTVLELHDLERAEQDLAIEQNIQRLALQPFDITTGPLLRVTLLAVGSSEHVMVVTMHHLIADAWSVDILLRELATLYAGQLAGLPVDLPALPIQYADFALWQRAWLQGAALEDQLAYWRNHLAGAPAVLELPTDHPRPSVQSSRGSQERVVFPAELALALNMLSQREGVTLFMTLLAGFQVLLSRYSGQTDLVVGSPIANRTRTQVEGLIGCFINTLLLRGDLRGNPTVRDLLASTREVCLGAYAHQDLPFEVLVEALQPERDLSHTTLFQVLFDFHNTPSTNIQMGDLVLEGIPPENVAARFDLALVMVDDGPDLIAILTYNCDLFERSTIQRLLGHFTTLLTGMTANPDCPIGKLPLLPAEEYHHLMIQRNATQTDYPADRCVHQLIADQAARTPGAIAAICGPDSLTYRELQARVNQLAHTLRAAGVGAEVRVGVCFERSLEMLVGLLGILTAGGAFVPLDPAFPRERMAYILEDAQVNILLTQAALQPRIPAESLRVICLDRDWPSIATASSAAPETGVSSQNLAYLIYTSGSTGRPKGVLIPHQGIVNYLVWCVVAYGAAAGRGAPVHASIAADAIFPSLFAPLLVGTSVVFFPGEHALEDLAAALPHGDTFSLVKITPSQLEVLTHMVPQGDANGWLRTFVIGAEALRGEVITFWQTHAAETILLNEYGPTETVVGCSIYHIPPDRRIVGAVPIGLPIANLEFYVLDQYMQPVPIGVPGELYIGGVGVAWGYLNRPALTAEKFVPHPFTSRPGARLYSTGDVVRWLADAAGNIEFLGRNDDQVKVRGYRVELGEVEAVLDQHPGVREVVVLARADGGGSKRLVAYVVGEPDHMPATSELREYLLAHMPEYMVPAVFLMLDVMPLAPHGKIDRSALPLPSAVESAIDQSFVAPRTPLEEQLTTLWEGLLDVAPIGVHSDFFELGGHSLLATQLIARIRTAFDIPLPLRSIFEAPTVADLASLIAAMPRPDQPTANPARQTQTISMREDRTVAPLSFAQQRLWFLDQLMGASPVYNVPLAIRLRGRLERAALAQGINLIVQRHETLRATFVNRDGQPAQVIAPALTLELPFVDLRDLAVVERELRLDQLIADEAQYLFDLQRSPLLRTSLIQMSEAEHILLLTMHHIVSDAWSLDVFEHELQISYNALSAGQEPSLPELLIQYADYAAWQRQWLQGPVLEEQLAYWQQQMAGHPPLLELPTDHPRPPLQTFNGAYQSLTIPAELSQALRNLSQQEGVTLFMTMLAVFQTLLARYADQDDISVGSPIANRTQLETEGLIGFFINTLVLRSDLSGNPSFRELLGRVREVALGAYEHQDLPFEQLMEVLQPVRNMSHSPLFQVMFLLRSATGPDPVFNDLVLEPLRTDSGVAKYDLTLVLRDTDQELRGFLEYNTDLFDAPTITRMLGHFQALVGGIVSNPDQRLAALPMLSPGEEQELRTWNGLADDDPTATLAASFEAQVARTPDSIALLCEQQRLTYAELNERANQLAHHLRSLGIGPEVPVAVCMERSAATIVALLAILKAGGVYLPLDLEYPRERLAFMLADAQVAIVVAQAHSKDKLPLDRVQLIWLDQDWPLIARQPTSNPASGVADHNLAYLIYTSGSTGQPKGVGISHKVAASHFAAIRPVFGLSAADRVLQFASLSFDVSLEQILPTLFVGARLVMRGPAIWSPAELTRTIREAGLTVVNLSPAYWEQWVYANPDLAGGNELATLRLVIVGGDILAPEAVRIWLQSPLGTVRLLNAYGPTETAITATVFELPVADDPITGQARIAIGRPVGQRTAYILDRNGGLVPPGVPGELCLGGPLLARGYRRRPDLTAEKFTPDPMSGIAGSRLYRTGDRARYRADGVIEVLGRIDTQVKLRGFRIEPGEIEQILYQHPAVQSAVVVVREVASAKRLVAYLVFRDGRQPGSGDLRAFVKDHLPEYMVPTAFVPLEQLPLTPNGKLDRRALPAPADAPLAGSDQRLAPRTPVEAVVAQIWAQVLRLEAVGIHDNFFELGGHSLLATQIVSHTRRMLHTELPLRSLFEFPTVAGIAEQIELAQHAAQAAHLPPLIPVDLEQDLPLSFSQQRLWFIDQLDPENPSYNLLSAFVANATLEPAALERSIALLVERHAVLRTTFVVVDGAPQQRIAPMSSVALTVVDLAGVDVAERQTAAIQYAHRQARQSFDLSQGPLLRVSLLRMGADADILIFVMHHIISDEWSFNVLLAEFTTCYAAFSTNQSPELAPLPIQYADFAVWQREWLQGTELERQMAYWRNQLAGAPPVLALPTDHPRPPVQSYHGAYATTTLPATLAHNLAVLSQHEGVTLFMTLLTGFQILLSRYSGQNDLVVGSPIAGRTRAETEGVVGCFINTLALRTTLHGQPTVRQLIRQVREVCLDAYAHQDLPFEVLVEALQPERDLSRTVVFQVLFDFHNAPELSASSGLELQPIPLGMHTSRFDLALIMGQDSAGLVASLVYNPDLFEAATIERMLGHLLTLLAALTANPDQPIATLPLLTAAEYQENMLVRNATQVSYPHERCLHEFIADQVARSPAAIAAICGEQRLTYAELDQRANQLAQYLRHQGVGPEVRVGVCFERSLEMLIGLLGILKAGGAFVPLDPAFPTERMAYILEDSAASCLLTQAHLTQRLPVWSNPVLCLDRDAPLLAKHPATAPSSGVTGQNLAYLIYTSGSTGRPKGVLIPHEGIVNYLLWCVVAYGAAAGRGAPVHASIAADAIFPSLFAPLFAGTSVIFLPGDQALAALADDMQQTGNYSMIKITPSQLEVLTHQLPAVDARGWVKTFVIGAEALRGEVLNFWQTNAAGTVLLNEYGPTETVVGCSIYHVPAGKTISGAVPIGLPIDNLEFYVLDRELQPVPLGVPGELYIGGAGVAWGYHNRPELTAEKFIPHPFTSRPGSRLYKTGDLVRWLADRASNIEFLGRNDDQVKVRGYRVELGEVEAVLDHHPGVREVVVLARQDASGSKRLVAYVVGEPAQVPTAADLREYVLVHLPEYMLPAVFVFLDVMPLAPHGKIDRNALPAPDATNMAAADAFVAPRSPIEEAVAGLWAELLELDQVGVYSDFFELGGHSLLATQLIARIRKTFQIQLPLRSIFEAPTVADLAQVIVSNEPRPGQTEKIALILKRIAAMSDSDIKNALQSKDTR